MDREWLRVTESGWGVDPTTYTNKTINFRITGLRLSVQKQLIAKISSTDRTFTFVTPPTVYLSGTMLLKQIITSETGPSLQSDDLNPTKLTPVCYATSIDRLQEVEKGRARELVITI